MITSYNTYEVKQMGGIWCSKISKVLEYLAEENVGIHWYKEKFRQPSVCDKETNYAKELIDFEQRLLSNNVVKNITTNGFIERDGVNLPSGHSSCSYVLNLNNPNLFNQIYLNTK